MALASPPGIATTAEIAGAGRGGGESAIRTCSGADPEASRARDLFDRGYRQGLVGIAELLQAQRQYNESRALYLELLGELRLAAIELEAATATSPHLAEFQGQGATP